MYGYDPCSSRYDEPPYDEEEPARLRLMAFVDGRLIATWTERVEESRWAETARRFDRERQRQVQPPPPPPVPTYERVLALCDEAVGNSAQAVERVRSAIESLDRLGETFERTRLELLRIRLDRGLGRTGAGEVQSKVAHALRPFSNYPDAPLFREARTLLGARAELKRGPKTVLARQMSPAQSLTSEDLPHAERLGLVGEHPEYLNALMLARAAATLPAPVLLLGEQGTGKSTFARLIHLWSKREGNFITFHCADLNDMVIGTELFGDAPGTGLLAAARGGTLFFDEIAELPPGVQRRLLSWLDEHTAEVRVIGASRYLSGDRCAAVIAASTATGCRKPPAGAWRRRLARSPRCPGTAATAPRPGRR